MVAIGGGDDFKNQMTNVAGDPTNVITAPNVSALLKGVVEKLYTKTCQAGEICKSVSSTKVSLHI